MHCYEGKPYATPPAPPVPSERVSSEPSFSNTGVDFVGPLYVKDVMVSHTESEEAYVCLFTCALTGALHLQLTTELSATVFLQEVLWMRRSS